eukprot:CAMPEP_0198284264 /NCGR_PEP_ID=MMETSP1449-20131203/3757_1 /TAXON_ID=420275 /ORGANISM="Attheya septentrionalis, Strain CCMP2084" /LENGTH=518 /DNA_ID=CAMNT_0043981257 /DNA_START=270 /DNA_END=1826 /DNA_ORIENTATION=-
MSQKRVARSSRTVTAMVPIFLFIYLSQLPCLVASRPSVGALSFAGKVPQSMRERVHGEMFRGGGDSEYDEYDDEEEDMSGISIQDDGKSSSVTNDLSRQVLGLSTKVIDIMTKITQALCRMWDAVIHPGDDVEDAVVNSVTKKSKKIGAKAPVKSDSGIVDFGTYLAKTYGVSSRTNEEDTAGPALMMGGSLTYAIRTARSQARLLVMFIPASTKSSKQKYDQAAIESLRSSQTARVVGKRPNKMAEKGTGSFLLWGAKSGSPEAITAFKRLKIKRQGGGAGKSSPTLLVAYPAQVFDSSGQPKVVPRLLSRHHCNPPPSAESMGAWLNAIRKRHGKQYVAMQHELRETRLFQERHEGYKSSVESDLQREKEEKEKELERLAKEKALEEEQKALEERRLELQASLPDEPTSNSKASGIITIALRFSDGRTGQRRFLSDTDVNVVFNWVDCTYKMEREKIVLSTMNGKNSFQYEENPEEEDGVSGVTLKSVGLPRMTGLRVTETKEEEGEGNDESSNEE